MIHKTVLQKLFSANSWALHHSNAQGPGLAHAAISLTHKFSTVISDISVTSVGLANPGIVLILMSVTEHSKYQCDQFVHELFCEYKAWFCLIKSCVLSGLMHWPLGNFGVCCCVPPCFSLRNTSSVHVLFYLAPYLTLQYHHCAGMQ